MRQRTLFPPAGGNIPGYNPSDYEDDGDDFLNSGGRDPGFSNRVVEEDILTETQWSGKCVRHLYLHLIA